MDNTIVIILPNSLTCESTKKIIDEMGRNYPVFLASEQHAADLAEEMLKKGTLVFISAGLAYEYIKERVPAPILEMPFSGIEAANAIKKALSYSDRIVHIGTRQLFYHIERALKLLDVEIESVHFCELTKDKSVREQTIEMIGKGYDVYIGGHVVVKTAREYGKQGLEVNVDPLIIRSTVIDAESLAVKVAKLNYENELQSAIMNSATDGIIAIDNDGKIFLMNHAANKIIPHEYNCKDIKKAMSENHVVNIDDISIDDIDPDVEYTPVIINPAPIILGGERKGSVYSIKFLADFQEMQYKKRQDLYVQGLWAEHTFKSIKGSSRAITLAKEKAKVYAQYNSPVLITGETGTGKEVFAQGIHNASRKKLSQWVPVNCASLPENLIESELFGYTKGAFTGANKEGKKGFFELANGGTIFLDEISELPISIQSKLLRVIQEGDVIRVGSNKIIHVDVRIICSSNKDLRQLIAEKKFKEDLYYRLNVLEIELPPLRERREDIIPLADNFLNKFNKQHGKEIRGFDPQAIQAIQQLPLNGNVRELSNIIERLVIFENGSEISLQTLMETVSMAEYTASSAIDLQKTAPAPAILTSGNFREAQKEIIIAALERNNGNKAATARELGIDPSTLWRRFKKYDIK